MRLLLDSANVEDAKRFLASSAVSGITTNPSLVAKEQKREYLDLISEIWGVVKGSAWADHLSVEATSLDPDTIVEQGQELATVQSLGMLHLKVPISIANLRVISRLRRTIPVNATACMTAHQAKLAADAGASIVSFFYNRMIDHVNKGGADNGGRRLAQEQIALFDLWRRKTQSDCLVICGSIRRPDDVSECWAAGADYVTASPKVIEEMAAHEATDIAVKKFQEDIERWQG